MKVIFAVLFFSMVILNMHSSLKLDGIFKNKSMNLVNYLFGNCFSSIVTVQ